MIIYGNGGRPFDRCDDFGPLHSSIGVGPQGDGIDVRVVEDDPYGYYRLQFVNSNTGEVLTTTPNLDPGSRFFLCTADLQTTTMSTREFTAGSGTFTTMQALTIQDARVGDLVIYDVSRLMSDDADRYHDFLGFGVITSINNDPDAGMLITFNEVMEFDTTMNIENLSIPTSKLENGAVTSEKIANGSVGWVKLADGAVHTDKLTDGAVTTTKIANKAITQDKLSDNVLFYDTMVKVSTSTTFITGVETEGRAWHRTSGADSDSGIGPQYVYTTYDLSNENALYVSVSGVSYGYVWPLIMFYDADNNVLPNIVYANSQTPYNDTIVSVPTGATKCVVNGGATLHPSLKIINYGNKSLYNLAKEQKADIEEINNELQSLDARNVRIKNLVTQSGATTTGVAWRTDGYPSSTGGYEYTQYDIDDTDVYVIVTGTSWGVHYPLISFYDSDSILISVYGATNGATAWTDERVDIPSGAVSCYVNGAINSSDWPSSSLKIMIDVESQTDVNNRVQQLLTEAGLQRKYLFIGDSYAQGYSHDGNNDGWPIYVAEYMGLSDSEYGMSRNGGAGFSVTGNSFLQLLQNASGSGYTDIVVCGGFNDKLKTKEQIESAINEFYEAATSLYPSARVHVGAIGYIKAGSGESAYQNWQDVRTSIEGTIIPAYQDSVKYGCRYLNNVEYMLGESGLTPTDGYHPSEAGNRAIAMGIANALLTGSAPIPYHNSLRNT